MGTPMTQWKPPKDTSKESEDMAGSASAGSNKPRSTFEWAMASIANMSKLLDKDTRGI